MPDGPIGGGGWVRWEGPRERKRNEYIMRIAAIKIKKERGG